MQASPSAPPPITGHALRRAIPEVPPVAAIKGTTRSGVSGYGLKPSFLDLCRAAALIRLIPPRLPLQSGGSAPIIRLREPSPGWVAINRAAGDPDRPPEPGR